MTSLSYYNSPLGRLLLRTEAEAVTGLWFVGQKYFPAELANAAPLNEDSEIIHRLKLWLDEYFAGDKPDLSRLKLRPEGSEFRKAVWDILCTIAYGHSMSYGQIARELERRHRRKVSAQAIGGAVGHNPISIIIPCHRVLSASGTLTGYAAGLDIKERLLMHEGINYTK